jgi:phage head maturation protease
MHVFNSSYDKHGDESRAFAEAWATAQKIEKANVMSDFSIFLPIAKVDREKRTVSGYASTPTKDSDGEIVTLDAIKAALPEYMTYGNIREMHALKAVGVAQEAHTDTKGLFLTAKIVDASAWEKCLEGVYKGFSIGGRKLDKDGDKITAIELSEISVVDRPANPDCRITLAKGRKDLGHAEGYLVKVVKRSAEQKALAKMAKVVEALALAKTEPPAAHDGFSLPAKEAAEGSDLHPNPNPKDDSEQSNKAMPDEGADLEKESDGGEPQPCEPHGKINCKKCKAKAKKIFKKSEKLRRLRALELDLGSKSNDDNNGNDFLTLRKVAREESDMDKEPTNDALTDAVLATLAKRAADDDSHDKRCAMAKEDVRKARKAMKECRKALEEAHKMHKAAYLSKAKKAGKPKDDDDTDDGFDHTGAMEKLQKAYGELDKARVFGKAAIGNLTKAESMPGRSGQKGQEVGDGNAHYKVPEGLKDLSPRDLATAGPGGTSSGGAPPQYPLDGGVYPGKADTGGDLAKYVKDGQIPADVVQLLVEKAQAQAEAEALRRVPANAGGRRPYAFDLTKVVGPENATPKDLNKALFDGVDPNALNSGDELAHTQASARVIGNFLTSGHFGKSVFDPAFKGAAGNAR